MRSPATRSSPLTPLPIPRRRPSAGRARIGGYTLLALLLACDGVSLTEPVQSRLDLDTVGDVSVPEDAGAQVIDAWVSALEAPPENPFGPGARFVVMANSNPELFEVAPAVSFPGLELTFEPAADAHGTAELSIRFEDGEGGVSPEHAFAIEVVPVNDAPTFTGDDVEVHEDTLYAAPWAREVSAGPPDEAGEALEFRAVENTAPELFATAPAISAEGALSFELAPNAAGSADVTVVLVDDGGTENGGVDSSPPVRFTIAVTAVNDPPSFETGPAPTVPEDAGPQRVEAWATGLHAGDGESFGEGAGFAVLSSSNPGLFAVAPALAFPSGDLAFTPAPDASGSAELAFELRDGEGGSYRSTGSVVLLPVNDPPSFDGPDVAVAEGSGAYSRPWAVEVTPGPPDEAGQALSYGVTVASGAELFTSGPSIAGDGTLEFAVAPHASGTAAVTARLVDDGGTANGGRDTSDPVAFTIAVSATNDPPSFAAGAEVAVVEDAGPRVVAGWATQIDPGPGESFASGAEFSVVGNSNPELFAVAPAVELASGALSFAAKANASGTAELGLQLTDGEGGASGVIPVTITVRPVNDRPVFTGGGDVAVQEGDGSFAGAWATGITPGPADEAGQSLTFSLTGNTAPSLFSTPPAVAPNGTLSFTPAGDAHGTANVTVALRDDGGTADGGEDTSESVSFSIAVTAANDPPGFAAGPNVVVLEDAGSQVVAGWATAVDPGPGESFASGAGFVLAANSNPGLFAAAPAVDLSSGDLSFTSAPGASGAAVIRFELRDGEGGTATHAAVSITVSPVNDAPVVEVDSVVVDEDSGAHQREVASAGPGEADQSLSVLVAANTNPGLFAAGPTVTADGTLELTPAGNAFGQAELTLELTDDGGTADGGTDTATGVVVVTVNPVNDAPVITAHLPAGDAGETTTVTSPREAPAGTIDLIAPRDTDSITYPGLLEAVVGPASESAQALTYSVGGDPVSTGSVSVAAGGTGDLAITFSGDDWSPGIIEIRAVDDGGTDDGGDDTAVLPLRISRNDGPGGGPDSVTGDEGTICIPIRLGGDLFQGMQDMDGDGDEDAHILFVGLPAGGGFTTASGTVVRTGEAYTETTYCFIPDSRAHSDVTIVDGEEVLDPYTEFTYRMVDDLGDVTELVVEIFVRPVFI